MDFDDDMVQALARHRRESGTGVSEAVNTLVRRGLFTEAFSEPSVQQTRRLGIRIDVSNVAEALGA